MPTKEDYDRVIRERGFVAGARIECKTTRVFHCRCYIVSVSSDTMKLRWETHDGMPLYYFTETAQRIDDKWYLYSVLNGLEIISLFGVSGS